MEQLRLIRCRNGRCLEMNEIAPPQDWDRTSYHMLCERCCGAILLKWNEDEEETAEEKEESDE